ISAYDLERDFDLPSAVSVVSGTSRAGREFVVVSSSGYYNSQDTNDPNNEPTAGVMLLVRDAVTGGFDNARSRELVRVGDNQLQNANALALLPNNDLLIADFDSNELRVIRDTDGDGLPDTLDGTPYYRYQLFDNVPLDAPLDIAVNSRGVVFSHSYGNDSVLLAIYDDNGDGRGDADEVIVDGLSLDNNLFFHGLTVDRVGTVYVIQDASGAADTKEDGGNGGASRIDAFPDPALNGILRDGALYFVADNEATDALSGLSFGVDVLFGAVGRLSMVNSASLTGTATRAGLATILGANLTRGASGTTAAEAASRGVRVSIEGINVPMLSFNDSQINVYIPLGVVVGANSVVITVNGIVTSADDATLAVANPGIFTKPQTGTGEAIALLASGMRYTDGPFPAKFDGEASVISLLGTGWRNSTPVSVTVGGRAAIVQYAGEAGGFNGLDQINLVIPNGIIGTVPVIVKTADNSTSRGDVMITIK
ncbi:MAG TPA: IPT/TIG domain-containing protein, partial [Pyrinomonadaceae bacterium]|nr:IPT/TIG domain-containing protein [Pyrinomonadaceae bacterium]